MSRADAALQLLRRSIESDIGSKRRTIESRLRDLKHRIDRAQEALEVGEVIDRSLFGSAIETTDMIGIYNTAIALLPFVTEQDATLEKKR